MIHSWLFHYISHCILIGKVTCRLYQKPAALNNQRYLKRVGLLCRLHIWWCRVSSITWLSSLCYFIGITILDMISSKAYVFLQCKSRTMVYYIWVSKYKYRISISQYEKMVFGLIVSKTITIVIIWIF